MNKNIISTLIVSLIISGTSFSADKKKTTQAPPAVNEAAVALLKPYDKNSDFEIDRDELRALQLELKANPRGPLAQFDLGKDGTLDDVIDRAGMNTKLGRAKMTTPAKKK